MSFRAQVAAWIVGIIIYMAGAGYTFSTSPAVPVCDENNMIAVEYNACIADVGQQRFGNVLKAAVWPATLIVREAIKAQS